MNVELTDHTEEVRQAMREALERGLEACGLAGEGYARALCPVDTGVLRNSITHLVSGKAAYIGTNNEYAPYVELGTGKYYPGGRPTPWAYQDAQGAWHRTSGQKAQPFLKPAATEHADKYRAILKDALKNG